MLIAALGQYFFGITIFVSSIFLIMLVLVQRGRGGGLAGALGGPGGQSAFGTKAGDLFTRITIVVAAVWIFLCASAVFFLKAKKFTTTGGKANAASGSIGSDGEQDLSTTSPLEGPNGAGLPGLDLMNSATTDTEAEVSDLPALDLSPSGAGTETETPPEAAPEEATPTEATPAEATPEAGAAEEPTAESPTEEPLDPASAEKPLSDQ